MEVLAVIAIVLIERARFDLHLRRWWSRRGVPSLALPVRVPVPVALAGLDARRGVMRVSSIGIAYVLYRSYWPSSSKNAYETVNLLIGQPFAFLGLALMAVLAVTAGRDRGEEILQALPSGARRRIGGYALLPTLAALASYVIVLVGLLRRDGLYFGRLPGVWDLAQVPALILGGGLLGVLAARLLPMWVAAPAAVISSVAWVVVLSRDEWNTQMLTVVIEWVQFRNDDRVYFEPGSFGWHNAFLFGLCALGLVAALLREPGRRRGLIATGAVLIAGTAAAGLLAMP